MSYGFHIRITKPITLHPEAMVRGVKMLMGETAQILEHQIGQRTPQGVGGTRTGLAASIFSEVREQGTRITTITGTNKPYAMPVEFGRRPGQRPPPARALYEWVGLRFGISDPKQLRSLAFLIARAIGKRGTRSMRNTPSGERMFERGLASSEPMIVQRAEQIIGQVTTELMR